MARITALVDPNEMPNQSQDQSVFDDKMGNVIAQLPERGKQENDLAAYMEALSVQGATGLPFLFDPGTAAGDPGAGDIRLNNASASAATAIYVSTSTSNGQPIAALLDTFDDSTNPTKGYLRLVKATDPSKWVVYALTAMASPAAGYRTMTVTLLQASTAVPFAVTDTVALHFTPNGDQGPQGIAGLNGRGYVLADTGIIAGSPLNIDYLNLFSDTYDHYTVEMDKLAPAATANLYLRLASGGTVQASGYSSQASASGDIDFSTGFLGGAIAPAAVAATGAGVSGSAGITGKIELRNTRLAGSQLRVTESSVVVIGASTAKESRRVHLAAILPVSGFRLYWDTGTTFAGGRVRVIGHRNS